MIDIKETIKKIRNVGVVGQSKNNETNINEIENMVKNILLQDGYTHIAVELKNNKRYVLIDNSVFNPSIFTEEEFTNLYIKQFSGLYFFIYQPNGQQNTPDFLICYNGYIFCLECKGTKKGKIQWNDNLPKNEYFYLIVDNKAKNFNKTILMMGKDFFMENEREYSEETIKLANKIIEERGLNEPNNSFGFTAKIRPKYDQHVNKRKSICIHIPDHINRNTFEINVDNFFNNVIEEIK